MASYTLKYEIIGWHYINNPGTGIGIIDGDGNNIVTGVYPPCPEARDSEGDIPVEYIVYEEDEEYEEDEDGS